MEELALFHEQLESLACVVREADAVKELLARVHAFRDEADRLLRQQENPESEVTRR